MRGKIETHVLVSVIDATGETSRRIPDASIGIVERIVGPGEPAPERGFIHVDIRRTCSINAIAVRRRHDLSDNRVQSVVGKGGRHGAAAGQCADYCDTNGHYRRFRGTIAAIMA
jgi:hypothetical protein